MGQLIIQVTDADGDTQEHRFDARELRIGRGKDCEVQLRGWRVGKAHARLVEGADGWALEDAGQFTGTWVNGARIVRYGPLTFADQIRIGSATLRVREADDLAAPARSPNTMPRQERVARAEPQQSKPAEVRPASSASNEPESVEVLAIQARHPWRKHVHDQLLETIDLRRRDLTRMTDAELRDETERLVREILDRFDDLPAHIDREALRKEVLDEAVGLGPLEDLLADASVTEVMVNRADEIFVERGGRLQRYPLAFTSDRAIMGVIERIVAPLGRRIDES